jgi:hypothetical protein
MSGEIIIGALGVGLMIVLAVVLSKPQKREMTGAEKDAYERRKGELQAEQESRRY